MDPRARDRSKLESLLTAARERLRALGGLLGPGAVEVVVVRGAIADALGALDDALLEISPPSDDGRVPCPTCGYRVMRAATLCLSCWRKLDPMRAG
jgi:hypothetical protein